MRYYLLLAACMLAREGFSQLTYDNLEVDYDSAWTFKNLKVIPVRYKGRGEAGLRSQLGNTVTLNEALANGLATVEERGTTAIENVHWLSLYNNSDKDILVSSGEVLAGGRQDRMVSRDTLIRANSGRNDLPVMCVEEGRWGKKSKKFAYRHFANTRLRKTLDDSRSQVMIWREISSQLAAGKVRNKTLAYLKREKDKKYTELQNEYWRFFEDKIRKADSNIVGVVCMSGDTILGSDIYVVPHFFYSQLQPMLHSYIEAASLFGAPPAVDDKTVKKYLDQFLTDETRQREFVKKNGKLFTFRGIVMHLTTY